MKKASLFHKRNAALKSQYKNFPVLSYKNDLKTGQIFSSVQPVTRGMETFLFPVQQSGRSPDLQIIMHCPLPGCPVSFWHALPKYSDEFVQDSHLFPFSPDPAEWGHPAYLTPVCFIIKFVWTITYAFKNINRFPKTYSTLAKLFAAIIFFNCVAASLKGCLLS